MGTIWLVLCAALAFSCAREEGVVTVAGKLQAMEGEMRDPTRVFDLEEDSKILVRSAQYADGAAYDLYYDDLRARKPLLVFVNANDDRALEREVGKGFKDLNRTVSWARMFAENGYYVLVYQNFDGENGIFKAIEAARLDKSLGSVDFGRLGLWASGTDGPLAIELISGMGGGTLDARCASFCYADMDWNASIPPGFRIQVLRAGKDKAANGRMDAFVKAGQGVAAIEVLDYQEGGHGFDYYLPINEGSKAALLGVVGFFDRALK